MNLVAFLDIRAGVAEHTSKLEIRDVDEQPGKARCQLVMYTKTSSKHIVYYGREKYSWFDEKMYIAVSTPPPAGLEGITLWKGIFKDGAPMLFADLEVGDLD